MSFNLRFIATKISPRLEAMGTAHAALDAAYQRASSAKSNVKQTHSEWRDAVSTSDRRSGDYTLEELRAEAYLCALVECEAARTELFNQITATMLTVKTVDEWGDAPEELVVSLMVDENLVAATEVIDFRCLVHLLQRSIDLFNLIPAYTFVAPDVLLRSLRDFEEDRKYARMLPNPRCVDGAIPAAIVVRRPGKTR